MLQDYIIQEAAGSISLVLLTKVLVIFAYTASPKGKYMAFLFTSYYLLIVNLIPVKGCLLKHSLLCFSFMRQQGFAINLPAWA